VGDEGPPLFVVKGDASPTEVAALVAVLQAVASAEATPARPGPAPLGRWSAHARRMRGPHAAPPAGPGGWRASAAPR
jgi:hypothetical protein